MRCRLDRVVCSTGQNFFPGDTQVLIGTQSCLNVTVNPQDFSSMTCSAPAGPGYNDSRLHVVVANLTTTGPHFLYDPPIVHSVSPTLCSSNSTCQLTLLGANLGLRSALSASLVVYVGNTVCTQPNVLQSTEVVCVAPSMPVGRYPVVVSLNGQNSSGANFVNRLCGERYFGLPGQFCGPCPKVHAMKRCSQAQERRPACMYSTCL